MRRTTPFGALLALAALHATAAPPEEAVEAAFGAPLEQAQLEGLRGGADTTVNDMKLSGTTAGNSAVNVTTGTNSIADGAFSSMSGIPLVVQNSGANVLIQNAVIVNLQMQ